MRRLIVLSLLAAGSLAVPASAAPVTVQGPTAHGVVHFGQQLRVELGGGCATATTRVTVTVRGTVTSSAPGLGCFPTVTVPTPRGFLEGQVPTIALVTGKTSVPLTYWRLQPAGGVPTTDPMEKDLGRTMGPTDSLDLGLVHLGGIQSIDVRNLTQSTGQWDLRVGSATGTSIAHGFLGSAGANASAGSAGGWQHSVSPVELRPSQLGELNTLGDLTPATGEAPHLFLTTTAPTTIVNWVDLNGPGVGLPHRFASEAGFTTLFDGTSFDGWRHTGPGHFVLKDGAMRAEHDPQDRGWAWEWYSLEQYSDFVLRLRFKVEDYEDNGGILLRHADPMGDVNRATKSGDEMQIQEGFENLTGGAAHVNDAYRLATGMVGQWNDVEIVSKGKTYVFRINGVEVNRFQTALQTRGFLAVENEQLAGTKGGHTWYDDIRVHRCTATDKACAV